MKRIDKLHFRLPTWGARKIRDRLRLEGYRVNRKRIQRLMRIMQINTIYPKKKLSRANLQDKKYPYLLRNMVINRPNQVWCTDITYIPLNQGFAYLVAIMDWYSRKVLTWRLSNTADNYFCKEALAEAISKYGYPEVWNSDQGSQFTSWDFLKPLLENKVKISMDGKGRAIDNIIIERFWRTLKIDEVYLRAYESMEDARKKIGLFIERYNHFRPHEALQGRTPDMFYHGIKKISKVA